MIERTDTVDAIPMRWLEAGEGLPVVFVHGIPTSPALWRHVVPHVAGARCLAWEMVGYGQSIHAGRGRDISVARQAEYLSAWLRHLELNRIVLVGHDLGGGVAQILATHEHERIAGLVLTNAIAYDSWPIPSVKIMRRLAFGLRLLPNAAMYPMFASLLKRGHDNAARTAESIEIHWQHYASYGAAQAMMNQVSALDVLDTLIVADKLRDLRVPARIVWGSADRFQKVKYGERLGHDLNAEFDRIDGGKHFTPEDHPDRIAAAVNDVCKLAG